MKLANSHKIAQGILDIIHRVVATAYAVEDEHEEMRSNLLKMLSERSMEVRILIQYEPTKKLFVGTEDNIMTVNFHINDDLTMIEEKVMYGMMFDRGHYVHFIDRDGKAIVGLRPYAMEFDENQQTIHHGFKIMHFAHIPS